MKILEEKNKFMKEELSGIFKNFSRVLNKEKKVFVYTDSMPDLILECIFSDVSDCSLGIFWAEFNTLKEAEESVDHRSCDMWEIQRAQDFRSDLSEQEHYDLSIAEGTL